MLQPGLPDPNRFQQADHYSALAQQCFINEYVFASGDDEIRQAIGLREYLSDQLANAALSKIELGRDGLQRPLYLSANDPKQTSGRVLVC